MDDSAILDLFFERNEDALNETADKYGAPLLRLSQNITESASDAEECVNDTYLEAWNRIPPTRPNHFFAWLAKVTRSFSYKKWERCRALKRSAVMIELTAELAECLSGGDSAADEAEKRQLGKAIDDFVRSLSTEARTIFVRRYFWSQTIADISAACGCSESKVASALARARGKLRKRLEAEGFRP